MIIRDYQDYELVVGCCPCKNPSCDIFSVDVMCDLVQGEGGLVGHVKPGDDTGEYKVLELKWADAPDLDPPQTGHIETQTYNTIIYAAVRVVEPLSAGGDRNVLLTPVQTNDVIQSGGDSYRSPRTDTYSDKLTYEAGINQIIPILEANKDFDKGVKIRAPLQGNNVLCQSYRFKGTESVSQQAARISIGYPVGLNPDFTRDYIKMSWDIYLMSEDYRNWLNAIRIYEFQKQEHDEWLACEALTPGNCGNEPYNPGSTPPTEPAIKPQLITHTEWEAIQAVPRASVPFELPVVEMVGATNSPERKAQNNIYVVNNIQAMCYRSASIGGVPTSFPTLEDYPRD